MLDINLFREEKGNNPERIRESQRRRFASVELVDEIIALDKEWRQRQYELENLRKDFNKINRRVAQLRISGGDASEMIASTNENKRLAAEKEVEVRDAWTALKSRLEIVGNLVHDSVPISDDEANNAVLRTSGEKRVEAKLKNHVELVELLEIADMKRGSDVAGGRGFYLKGDGVRLNQALINFGLDFLEKRGYTALQTPFFMRKEIMAKCAQLAQFDEELYKVTGEGDDKYLIATAEQPLCAYHLDEWIQPTQLPLRYAGYSSCFRKEAGSHGRDTLGIFRVHQFEKVEQFCITSPNGNDSWDMHEEMIKNSEEFYQALKIPYQVVAIVSGALNDAAAKKYDLEGWFPASQTYRELVSCSNCTDYQSRRLETRFGQKKVKVANSSWSSNHVLLSWQLAKIESRFNRKGGEKKKGKRENHIVAHEFTNASQVPDTNSNISSATNTVSVDSVEEGLTTSLCYTVRDEHFMILLCWQGNEQAKQYVHLLNSTLTATERTICCILENYQREDGVEVPEPLRLYMGGKDFLPFKGKPAADNKGKKSKA